MDTVRFWPGSYVVWRERSGVMVYWRGNFDEFYQPRDTQILKFAAIFISARHAYCCAGEHPRLKSWRVKRVGDTRRANIIDWDSHFSDRLIARLFKQPEVEST